MSYIERQTSRITGVKSHDDRRQVGRKKSAIGGTGKVPNAKKPRSRPPTSLRDKLGILHSHLPPSSGPYSVGSMDIEVPVDNPRTFSNITRNGKHVLQLETVLFTLYYPAAIGTGRGKDPGGHRKWSRETWLSRPRLETAKGYAKFAGLSNPVGISYFALTTMLTKLRAFRNAPPATHWPPEGNRKQNGHRIKDQRGEPPEGSTEEPVFPLLLFTHGLGGSRTCYSTMCTEFASYGFVVCAVEHRDGSGPRSIINHPRAEGKLLDPDLYDAVDHTDKERKRGFDKIDYIFPKDNPKDTSPNNEKGVDRELRNAQIELRVAELEEAFRILREINNGRGIDVAERNLRRGGYVGGSTRGLDGVDWLAWKGRFYVDKITVAGHSFGAATIVEVLRNTDRFENVQAGIIYDIWGAPIKPPEEDPQHRIHLPILGINSEAFMYWQANFDAVMSLMDEAKEQNAPAFLATVRGSVHVSQSDFSILYNHLVSLSFKATVNPQRAIDLNISASLEFLRDVTEGAGKCIIQRCLTDDELLQAEPLEQVPEENKPEDAYIATRLKVRNNFRTRLATRVQRKVKRAKAHGLYNKGDEMWIHCRPNPDELQNWRIRNRCTTAERDESKEHTAPGSRDGNNEDRRQEAPSSSSLCVNEKELTDETPDIWLGRPPTLT